MSDLDTPGKKEAVSDYKMNIEEVKERVAALCVDWGQSLPYEPESVEGETWEELADHLAQLASVVATGATRIAAYASIARRKANR